jgi:hypothetical protein
VLRYYVYPVNSKSLHAPLKPPTWSHQPDVGRLACLCERLFDWGERATIVKRFISLVYPGITMRALQTCALFGPGRCLTELGCPVFGNSHSVGLVTPTGRSRENRLAPHIKEEQFSVNLDALIPLTTAKLRQDRYADTVPNFQPGTLDLNRGSLLLCAY